MTVKYGAGTDPLTLDDSLFEFIDKSHAEALDIQSISKSDGTPLQDDAREETETVTLQYYCKTDTPETDAPAIGATTSGYLIISRDFKRNQKGHAQMTLTAKTRVVAAVTVAYPLS